MKRAAQALLTVVALALIAAGPPGTPKTRSTDDPKDLEAIGGLGGGHVDCYSSDDSENIHGIKAGADLKKPGAWMKHLKGLRDLAELELPNFRTEDDDLAYLVGLQSLQKLEVKGGKFSDAGMKSIGAVASLRELCLVRCAGITSDGMKYVAQLENLERLDLHQSPVADDGLRILGKLKKLKELNLAGAKITDAGLAHLAALQSIETLDLEGTSVTDAGLRHLETLKHLREISCKGTAVTRDGLVRLNKYVPALLLPDDPDDSAMFLQRNPSRKVDAHGNIIEIEFSTDDLKTSPEIGPALRRLQHVREVSVWKNDGHVLTTDFVKHWSELESIAFWLGANDDDLHDLEGQQKLKDVAICDGCITTDQGVESIARHKNLEGLIIRNSRGTARLTDACMKDIASLPMLRRLDLRGNPITDAGMKELKGKKLESLGLRETRITDRGIDEIKDMASLRELDVMDTKVTNASLETLKGIPELKVSGLPREEVHETPDDPADVAAIEAAGVSVLKSNVTDNLHHVNASHLEEAGEWMKHLKGLHSIEELRLPKECSDDDLKSVAGLKSLESLHVGGDFSDEGLKAIGTLTNLKELLCGSSSGLTSVTAKHLAPLVNLESLDLTNDPVGDEGLRYLAGMKKLKKLGLIGTKITDAGLVHLQGLSALEEINLMFTAVTDDGLQNLRGLKNLRSIDGVGSRETLLRLKKDLPKLFVPTDPP